MRYKDIWKINAYRWNLIAGMIGRLGDSIDMIGFSWMMYGLTESTFYTAVVFGVNMLPTILFQPFAGAMIEQLSKKKIIVVCDFARSFLILMVLLLYLGNKLNPLFLLFVTFFNNLLESFRMPAGTCFLADTLSKETYESGVGLYQSASRACELVGTGIAGVIISCFGIGGALVCDMIAFFLCAVIISRVYLVESNEALKVNCKESIQSTMSQLKGGIHYLISKKSVFLISIIASLINAGLVPLNSFESAYVRGSLQGSAILLSGLSLCISCGAIFGSFMFPYFHKLLNKRLLLSIGIAIGGYNIVLAGIPFCNDNMWRIIILLCCSLIIGIMSGCGSVLVASSFMVHVEKSYLARVSAIFNSVASAFLPILSFLVAFLSKRLNILPIFLGFGLIFIVIFVLLFRLKEMEEI